jgi:hypothetical protein
LPIGVLLRPAAHLWLIWPAYTTSFTWRNLNRANDLSGRCLSDP